MGWSRVIEPVRDEYRDRDGIDATHLCINRAMRRRKAGEDWGKDRRLWARPKDPLPVFRSSELLQAAHVVSY
jgi:hypothetical protein